MRVRVDGRALAFVVAMAAMMYFALAWGAFQWRNPTANSMSAYRDFSAVVAWKKLDKYQPPSGVEEEKMRTMVDSVGCECCGCTTFEVAATLIRCCGCNCFWGRCEGLWKWDPTDCTNCQESVEP